MDMRFGQHAHTVLLPISSFFTNPHLTMPEQLDFSFPKKRQEYSVPVRSYITRKRTNSTHSSQA